MGNTYDGDVTKLGGLPYVPDALNLPPDFPAEEDRPKSPIRRKTPRRPVIEVPEEG